MEGHTSPRSTTTCAWLVSKCAGSSPKPQAARGFQRHDVVAIGPAVQRVIVAGRALINSHQNIGNSLRPRPVPSSPCRFAEARASCYCLDRPPAPSMQGKNTSVFRRPHSVVHLHGRISAPPQNPLSFTTAHATCSIRSPGLPHRRCARGISRPPGATAGGAAHDRIADRGHGTPRGLHPFLLR